MFKFQGLIRVGGLAFEVKALEVVWFRVLGG